MKDKKIHYITTFTLATIFTLYLCLFAVNFNTSFNQPDNYISYTVNKVYIIFGGLSFIAFLSSFIFIFLNQKQSAFFEKGGKLFAYLTAFLAVILLLNTILFTVSVLF